MPCVRGVMDSSGMKFITMVLVHCIGYMSFFEQLWCCGNNVPGVWLESTVCRIKRGNYLVLRTQGAGSVWVGRDRIRPRRRKAPTDVGPTGTTDMSFGELCVSKGSSCAVM